MSKKKRTQKGSPKSNKEKPEEESDMSEYEESFDGDIEGEPAAKVDEVDYDEYELPEDFELPDIEEVEESELKWFQRRIKSFREMDNNQRLYWIKILTGSIIGIILGIAGAKTGWWLLLMIGVYAAITAGGYFLFKLDWNFKEIIFNGFFPYLALFTLFWVLMFTSLYAPTMADWWNILETIITTTTNGTEIIYTSTRTTSAAGIPYVSFILVVLSTLGLMTFLLRRQKRRENQNQ
ncbi:MAG: hypothetical protein FK730_07100 [Asgard group archaeon]|nr:hypothetical protein [Asgard group archaeon]